MKIIFKAHDRVSQGPRATVSCVSSLTRIPRAGKPQGNGSCGLDLAHFRLGFFCFFVVFFFFFFVVFLELKKFSRVITSRDYFRSESAKPVCASLVLTPALGRFSHRQQLAGWYSFGGFLHVEIGGEIVLRNKVCYAKLRSEGFVECITYKILSKCKKFMTKLVRVYISPLYIFLLHFFSLRI